MVQLNLATNFQRKLMRNSDAQPTKSAQEEKKSLKVENSTPLTSQIKLRGYLEDIMSCQPKIQAILGEFLIFFFLSFSNFFYSIFFFFLKKKH